MRHDQRLSSVAQAKSKRPFQVRYGRTCLCIHPPHRRLAKRSNIAITISRCYLDRRAERACLLRTDRPAFHTISHSCRPRPTRARASRWINTVFWHHRTRPAGSKHPITVKKRQRRTVACPAWLQAIGENGFVAPQAIGNSDLHDPDVRHAI